MNNNAAFPITKEQAESILKIKNKLYPSLPEYYDTMYLDGYEPWQIIEANQKRFYGDYIERIEAYESSQKDSSEDYQLNIKSEVNTKK